MSLPHYNDTKEFNNTELCEQIVKTEKELFNLRFKKATLLNHMKLKLLNVKLHN